MKFGRQKIGKARAICCAGIYDFCRSVFFESDAQIKKIALDARALCYPPRGGKFCQNDRFNGLQIVFLEAKIGRAANIITFR
jgi:hypothetical protein